LIALAFLDLEEKISDFSYCDVKSEHFGAILNGGGNDGKEVVVIVDADHFYPKHFADALVADGRPCREDRDCDHLDCRGVCSRAKKCSSKVTNDNLQLICEKVFMGRFRQHFVQEPGLLDSRRASSELKTAVRECGNPGNQPGSQRRLAATEFGMREKLRSVLRRDLMMVETGTHH